MSLEMDPVLQEALYNTTDRGFFSSLPLHSYGGRRGTFIDATVVNARARGDRMLARMDAGSQRATLPLNGEIQLDATDAPVVLTEPIEIKPSA